MFNLKSHEYMAFSLGENLLRKLYKLVINICICISLYFLSMSIFQISKFYSQYFFIIKEENEIYNIANMSDDTIENSLLFINKEKKEKTQLQEIQVNFDELYKINPDIVGWIYIPNTKINYPIVKGKDNQEYLDKSFKKDKSKAGCIFMDYRNVSDWLDQNTIIYGHNMSMRRMFSDIKKFKEEEFFKENEKMYIYTPYTTYEGTIYSFHLKKTSSDIFAIQFNTSNEFEKYLNQTINHSNFKRKIKVNYKDKIVTLITCVSGEDENLRYILHAKLRKI